LGVNIAGFRARIDDCGEALRGGRTLTGESLQVIHKIVTFYINFGMSEEESRGRASYPRH